MRRSRRSQPRDGKMCGVAGAERKRWVCSFTIAPRTQSTYCTQAPPYLYTVQVTGLTHPAQIFPHPRSLGYFSSTDARRSGR